MKNLPSWAVMAAGVGLFPMLLLPYLMKRKTMNPLTTAIGEQFHALENTIKNSPGVSRKRRDALLGTLKAAFNAINEARTKQRVEDARVAAENEKRAREEGQTEGLRLAVTLLRAHEASILIHLTAQETLDAVNRAPERVAVRTFAAGVVSMFESGKVHPKSGMGRSA